MGHHGPKIITLVICHSKLGRNVSILPFKANGKTIKFFFVFYDCAGREHALHSFVIEWPIVNLMIGSRCGWLVIEWPIAEIMIWRGPGLPQLAHSHQHPKSEIDFI